MLTYTIRYIRIVFHSLLTLFIGLQMEVLC